MVSTTKSFALSDKARIVRPDGLNWELQIYRDEVKPNVKAAVAARGGEARGGWRTVGYYSTIAQAISSAILKYPDRVFPHAGELYDLVDSLSDMAKLWADRHDEELAIMEANRLKLNSIPIQFSPPDVEAA